MVSPVRQHQTCCSCPCSRASHASSRASQATSMLGSQKFCPYRDEAGQGSSPKLPSSAQDWLMPAPIRSRPRLSFDAQFGAPPAAAPEWRPEGRAVQLAHAEELPQPGWLVGWAGGLRPEREGTRLEQAAAPWSAWGCCQCSCCFCGPSTPEEATKRSKATIYCRSAQSQACPGRWDCT